MTQTEEATVCPFAVELLVEQTSDGLPAGVVHGYKQVQVLSGFQLKNRTFFGIRA